MVYLNKFYCVYLMNILNTIDKISIEYDTILNNCTMHIDISLNIPNMYDDPNIPLTFIKNDYTDAMLSPLYGNQGRFVLADIHILYTIYFYVNNKCCFTL